MTENPIRVLPADDHAIVRQGPALTRFAVATGLFESGREPAWLASHPRVKQGKFLVM